MWPPCPLYCIFKQLLFVWRMTVKLSSTRRAQLFFQNRRLPFLKKRIREQQTGRSQERDEKYQRYTIVATLSCMEDLFLRSCFNCNFTNLPLWQLSSYLLAVEEGKWVQVTQDYINIKKEQDVLVCSFPCVWKRALCAAKYLNLICFRF